MAIQPINNSDQAGPSRSPYKATHTLTTHTRAVTALKYSGDGRTLVSGGADGWVHFWDGQSNEYIGGFKAHPQGINDLAISPDSLYLVTASDSLVAHLHQLRPPPGTLPASSTAPLPLQVYEGHTAPILSISFSPTSNMLVSGSMDESAIIWDVKSGSSMRQLPAHSEAVWCVGWDAGGGICITSSADGLIRLWDASSGQCLKTFDNDTNSPVSYAGFTPSSTYLFSSTLSSVLRIYNIHTANVLKTFRHATYVSERFPCPAIVFTRPSQADASSMHIDETSKAEAWLVSGSENGKIVIWDVGSRNVVGILEGHERPVVALAVSPDGRRIASGTLEPEKTIRIWKIESRETFRPILPKILSSPAWGKKLERAQRHMAKPPSPQQWTANSSFVAALGLRLDVEPYGNMHTS